MHFDNITTHFYISFSWYIFIYIYVQLINIYLIRIKPLRNLDVATQYSLPKYIKFNSK